MAPDSRRSVTGFCVFLSKLVVSWRSKKQRVVSHSSVEAEYRAMVSTCCELTWLRYLLSALQIDHPQPAGFFVIIRQPFLSLPTLSFHEWTKHIEFDCHLIRDQIYAGLLRPLHVSTQSQLVDIFTKALPSSSFYTHLLKITSILHLAGVTCRT